ncbi:centrosome-associated zinc finger protein CP190 isoform X2 [Megachile rotundata]|nr:PREDICTED: centrosome-associated zinc finger protein CP190-like isoform X2 [Megachile rotundata]XP_012138676.1 PREDICTED: centrosome-associated zinc finger protein CP190-like isoform X2 [Megachile rotundata]XP_012138677.1 PREDICTED: centrosome-associated zinc finger protein CP190-like isoform X2 [Megachile rotundata]XP_012138678.1 PREDICTED: centrosome-associated zinc finger protein CP190-like isoform X2 [Megachile rotundata]XP_012138679.1 PREDICTED: centrosome-associated zinc finger protein
METGNLEKQSPSRGLKQVKVDNWGTFFLQRLQQLYFDEQLLDLTIKFPTSDITVQAHRLVVTTCTNYFMQLEHEQKARDENFDGVIIMPTDMPYECVKSIISFMYTGQLEYWTSEQHALYRTAQKMNMTVLTKLLDAQFNTAALQNEQSVKCNTPPATTTSKPSTSTPKPAATSTPSSGLSNQPLPGRKLPIWKRKLDTPQNMSSFKYEMRTFHGIPPSKSTEVTPGPSRFDLPEAEEFALGVFSSFDDITYNTKPIVQAPDVYKRDNSPSGKCSPDGDSKNDTTEDEEDENHMNEKSLKEVNSDDDWSIGRCFQRGQETQPSPSKKVRFDREEKENMEKGKSSYRPNSEDSINNHAKIIREVLKKYPHLVKNNKNIRLKIMQKEAKSADSNSACKTKVSYVVLKSDHLMSSNNSDETETKSNGNVDGGETGPWKCNKCDLEEEYTNYYMYRRHMQDVHEEKFDPRICEHCGYKATKRNILMYHLYTKHNVPPPKSMCFPKCQSCSYVALSETLLVRHQINHNHRPTSRQHSSTSEEIQCMQCAQTFKDVTELTTHEINTGHGSLSDSKEKGHRCTHCGKIFVRATNLQVHLDCVHKDLRDSESNVSMPSLSLEPSSEAEALSHVASGIAASLGVGDTVPAESHEVTSNVSEYVVPDMQLNNITHEMTYNTHELDGQHMIMLIDNENYQQQENEPQQQPQQLNISDNEQIVMQGTEDGMIVYIHGSEGTERQTYENYQQEELGEETEEIVEEVVEEVEEKVMEEEDMQVEQSEILEECNADQVEEVIQYVEEQTEIVEYDEQCSEQSNSADESHESVMIIEEEHVEGEQDIDKNNEQNTRGFTKWDEDSRELSES